MIIDYALQFINATFVFLTGDCVYAQNRRQWDLGRRLARGDARPCHAVSQCRVQQIPQYFLHQEVGLQSGGAVNWALVCMGRRKCSGRGRTARLVYTGDAGETRIDERWQCW